MKTKPGLLMAALALWLCGCVVPALQPLFADKDVIPYPALVGTWTQQDGDKEQGRWTFETEKDRYRLRQRDESGREATFLVAAGKLGGQWFLDFVPENPAPREGLNDFVAVSLLPGHVFVKAWETNNGLMLVAMDVEWLDRHLQENPRAIAHVIQDKRAVLTASTGDLQQFFRKHAADTNAFKNPIRLVRKK